MPRYEFKCCSGTQTFVIKLPLNDYKEIIPCPCGKGDAKRVFNTFNVQNGLTAKEKQFGTTEKRKDMAEFARNQKDIRKQSYSPDSREAKSNEIWTGKEGLDGITSLPIDK